MARSFMSIYESETLKNNQITVNEAKKAKNFSFYKIVA